MRKWLLKFKIWFVSLRFKEYDRRVIRSVQVRTFWGLNHCVVGEGVVLIPLRLRREDEEKQILLILNEFRTALALRIFKEK